MDDNNELIIYVLRQLRYGVPEQTIRETLAQNGWPMPLIDRAFSLVQQAAPHTVPPTTFEQAQANHQEMSLPATQPSGQTEAQPNLRPSLPQREKPANDTKPSGAGRRFLIIFLVLILLAGAGVGGYFAYKAFTDKSEEKPKQQATTQTAKNKDDKRKKDLGQISGKLSEYYNAKQTYPTLAQINSGGFASTSKGFDITKYKDPVWDAQKSACKNERGGVIFSDSRSEGCYTYRATALNGGECDGEGIPCTRVVLTANLEGNKPHIIALDRNRQE
jgi:hypothetical protein